MDNKTLAKLYLHAKEQKNSKDIAEYEQQILAIDGFDVGGLNAQCIYEEHFRECCSNINSLTDKHAKKNVDKALECLQIAEDYYSKLQDKSMLESQMGYCYCRVALCYDAKPEGKASIAGLVERALEREIPLVCLAEMCKHKGLSEELRKLINEAITVKQKADFLNERFESLKITLPNFNFVKSGKGYESSIVPQDKNFCVELFKKALFATKTCENNPNVVEALKSKEAAVDVKLFYLPLALVKWEASPITFSWSWSDSFDSNGTFDYSGWFRYLHYNAAGAGDALLGRTADKVNNERLGLDTPTQALPANIDCLKSQLGSLYCPYRASDAEYDAKQALSERIGKAPSTFTVRAQNRPSYTHEVTKLLYVPFYAIRIVNGNYIAKGTINAYYTDDVRIEDVASIENGYHSYYGVEFKAKESIKPAKKRVPIKLISGIALLAAIIMIAVSLFVKGFGLTISMYAAAPALILWIVCATRWRRATIWGVLSIVASLASIVLSVLLLLA